MLQDEIPEQITIDVTPMATIALILVIIFVSSSTAWIQPTLKVDLPKASTAESERKQNLTVSIGALDELAIDDVTLDWARLYEGVLIGLENNPDKFVIIRADRSVSYGRIIQAMSISRKAGARSITIATEQKQKEASERVR